jgi:dihydrofolate reductase
MIVTLIAAVSADGKIARDAGQSSLDWTSREDKRFFMEKTKQIGTVVMGRSTFETIGKPLPGRRTVVLSRKGHEATGLRPGGAEAGTVEFTDEPLAELVARLEREGATGLAVCGGATVYSQFLKAGLVDELFLTVEPMLFGTGVPLVSDVGRINLALVSSAALGPSSVLLHYRIEHSTP